MTILNLLKFLPDSCAIVIIIKLIEITVWYNTVFLKHFLKIKNFYKFKF